MTILVLDHDPAVRGTLRRLLEPDGHTVLDPPAGRGEIAAMTEGGVDLTFVDAFTDSRDLLELFLTGGTALAQSDIVVLKRDEQPVGRAEEGWLDALGARAVLWKPIPVRKLLSTVAEIAARRTRWARTETPE